MEALKNIGKGFLVLGIVGVLLALVSPAIATMVSPLLGPSAAAFATETAAKLSANALWEGAFFGGFGALHAAVVPAMDWMFGKGKETTASAAPTKIASCDGHSHGVNITNTQIQPDIAVAADVKANLVEGNENMVGNKAKLYTQMLNTERATHNGQAVLAK